MSTLYSVDSQACIQSNTSLHTALNTALPEVSHKESDLSCAVRAVAANCTLGAA